MFSSPEELKRAIVECSAAEFFENHILSKEADHFHRAKRAFVAQCFSDEYRIDVGAGDVVVVGSSKLGYALHDKRRNGSVVSQAFRRFGSDSDIDISLCSTALFTLLWREISAYLCKKTTMPHKLQNLGDYLSYGWLRLDRIPPGAVPNLINCHNVTFVRGRVRRSRDLGHPKVDFGIFYDLDHLKYYQLRSIDMCRKALEAPL